ncbi:SDR family oxidoreductase [Pseudonocardia sp. GCM10023141]|uniref:SDR family oxidoreductase n=1 Tax=Pseudonocardia sp. GCM10023141 TaxID=3252653 RepID=UPI00361EA280
MDTLVTGGTGTLGRVLVERLAAAGTPVRVLSRREGPGRVVGDLDTGAGLDAAVRDAGVIVHAATRAGHDVAATQRLVDAAVRAGTRPHLVYVSIVGIDQVPMGYYKEKLAAEEIAAGSGLPWTIQRATQFHDLLDTVFRYGAKLPVLPVLSGASFQPVDVQDVAARLVELATAAPAGHAPDLGGPAVRPMRDLASVWLAARGKRRPLLPVRVPGGIGRGLRAGGNLTPAHAEGRITFEDFLATTRQHA